VRATEPTTCAEVITRSFPKYTRVQVTIVAGLAKARRGARNRWRGQHAQSRVDSKDAADKQNPTAKRKVGLGSTRMKSGWIVGINRRALLASLKRFSFGVVLPNSSEKTNSINTSITLPARAG
jgi:hypothetical protein